MSYAVLSYPVLSRVKSQGGELGQIQIVKNLSLYGGWVAESQTGRLAVTVCRVWVDRWMDVWMDGWGR